eukprot:1686602-Pleurochrysis_carterae.AAC.1
MQGLSSPPGELSLHASEMQILPMQSPEAGDESEAEGPRAGGRAEGAHTGMAAGGQRLRWERSGPELRRGDGRQRQRRDGRTLNRAEEGREAKGIHTLERGVSNQHGTKDRVRRPKALYATRASAIQITRRERHDNCGITCGIECTIQKDRMRCAQRDNEHMFESK